MSAPPAPAPPSREELLVLYKRYLRQRERAIQRAHKQGASGLELCRTRSRVIDTVLRDLLQRKTGAADIDAPGALQFTLVATGGYGRGLLNPASDLDLLFLLPPGSERADPDTAHCIEVILYLLWDLGFKVGQAVRGLRASIEEAAKDPRTKCSFIEMRRIAGPEAPFQKLAATFRNEVILKHEAQFLDERRADLRSRQEKSSGTVFLQEPNVKLSLGGLRDYHLMTWGTWVKRGTLELRTLLGEGLLSPRALAEVEAAHDFLLRVRNELHYQTGKPSDLLTLRLQGLVAERIGYPQRTRLRRIEAFMRDYYRHAQHLLQHSSALLESFEIEQTSLRPGFSLRALVPGLAPRPATREPFDGFYARDGRLHPQHSRIFAEDPGRLMRVFQHAQVRALRLAPELKALVREHLPLVDRAFRTSRAHRQTFEAILTRRGSVARSLRQMHRVEFLGAWLPEFGKLDCLVQHEFFHRYTADEHTLRTIDWLDSLADSARPQDQRYQAIFRSQEDPFLFYLALLLHDTGRAEEMRQHEDGSAVLTAKVCNRLGIHGQRRKTLMFLVVHHLTLFRTATTRNPDDPQVVREFAQIIGDPIRLDALLLFSWADSHGTSDDAWNGWKEAMMLQLYHNTRRWWEKGGEAFRPNFDDLRAEVAAGLHPSYGGEIAAHFEGMRSEYFTLREAAPIIRHIRLYRRFFAAQSLRRSPQHALHPVLQWRDVPEAGWTVLTLCNWDRVGLLTRIAASLTARRINILSAELYTRADDTALNVLRVCNSLHEPVSRPDIRAQVERDLTHLLQPAPPDPEALVARAREAAPAPTEKKLGLAIPARVIFDNREDPRFTTLHIQAADRVGLLYDVFRILGEHQLDVVHARIATEKGAAIDTLQINDARDQPVRDPQLLATLRRKLEAAIGVEEGAEPGDGP